MTTGWSLWVFFVFFRLNETLWIDCCILPLFVFETYLDLMMDRDKYQAIFDYISSQKPNSAAPLTKWKAYPDWAVTDNEKRNFRQKCSHFDINQQDGLLYRKAEKKHAARPVLLADDSHNQLVNAHGPTHRGINEM